MGDPDAEILGAARALPDAALLQVLLLAVAGNFTVDQSPSALQQQCWIVLDGGTGCAGVARQQRDAVGDFGLKFASGGAAHREHRAPAAGVGGEEGGLDLLTVGGQTADGAARGQKAWE